MAMEPNDSGERAPGGGGGGGSNMGGVPAPAPTPAPAPPAPPAASQAGPIQENAEFRGLPRHIQVFIEQSQNPFETLSGVINGTINPGGGSGQPTPGPSKQSVPTPTLEPEQQMTAPVKPAPGPESASNTRLGTGQVSEAPGTFSLPGTRSFGSFQGRAFGKDLQDLSPGATAKDVLEGVAQRTGMRTGSIGRQPISGVSGGAQTAGEALGGLGGEAGNDALINAALKAQGLA